MGLRGRGARRRASLSLRHVLMPKRHHSFFVWYVFISIVLDKKRGAKGSSFEFNLKKNTYLASSFGASSLAGASDLK